MNKKITAKTLSFLLSLMFILSACTPSDDVAASVTDPAVGTSDITEALSTEAVTQGETQIFPVTEAKIKLNHRSHTVYAHNFKGTFDSAEFSASADAITITPGSGKGTYTSEDIDLGGEFTRLVCSWNAVTNGGTVEIYVQAKKADGTYTLPFSWGIWSSEEGVSGSANTSNSDGKVNVDVLDLTEKCSGAIRFTAKLKNSEDGISPELHCVTFATNKESGALSAPESCEVKLNVPRRLQGVVPEIGGRICSPTSLSMVLEYLGEKDFPTERTAYAAYDNTKDIFGNWSFNVAHAGELGYNAIFDYYDTDALKFALTQGTPVVCSIKIKAGQLAGSGYPNRTTNGHLITVIGHTTVGEKDYFIINDPAVSPGCEIKLLVNEFETIWTGGCYVVQHNAASPSPESVSN